MRPAPAAMSERDLVVELCRGNPGALRVSMELIKSGHRETAEKLLTLGIVGPRVWLCYKDLGDETIATLIANIAAHENLVSRLTALGYAPEAAT